MSGYIHTIGFKVLIDSDVVDFTFRVPRGTLLIQIMDELQTTLRIEPRIIATINLEGEIIVIENHYSTIDFLVQKHGTEFYAGDSSVITFNHGEYIIDLEVPEAIPFSATYRTACKSFTIKTRDVAIERQDGQVMDADVFSMPTAFVLNSWGTFYRFVDRHLGDVLVELDDRDAYSNSKDEFDEAEDSMVYPPKLEELDIVEIASKLVEVSEQEQADVDKITDHYLDRFEEQEQQEEYQELEEEVSELIEEVEEEIKPQYPWEKSEVIEEEPFVETFESEMAEEAEDKSMVEEVFKGIFVDEEQEKTLHESPIDDFDSEEEFALDEVDSEFESIDLLDEDQIDETFESEELIQTYDKPIVEEVEVEDKERKEEIVIEEEEELEDEQINAFDNDETSEFKEESMLYKIQELKQVIEDTDIQTELPEPTNEDLVKESEEQIEEDIVEETTEEVDTTEELPKPFITTEDLPLNERLEIRKQELVSLQNSLKTEEKMVKKFEQRSIGLSYYERMHPQKLYPLTIKIPPPTTNGNGLEEIKIRPIFPGCYVTPSEEVINLDNEKMVISEFNITPIIGRGKVNGKVGLWYKNTNILAVNTPSRVANVFWPSFTLSIGIILGLLPFIIGFFTTLNTLIADAINNSISANVIQWFELGLFLVLLSLSTGLFINKRPLKKSTNKKFYPVKPEDEG